MGPEADEVGFDRRPIRRALALSYHLPCGGRITLPATDLAVRRLFPEDEEI